MVSVMVRVCMCVSALRLVSSAFLPHEALLPSSSSHVLTTEQLNPHHAMDSMEMPMMMPMPLTTALQKHMQKGMQAMTAFMGQMQMMPMHFSSMQSPMHSMPSASPCAAMSSMPTMSSASSKPDIMSLIQQLTQQLNPMNLFNNFSSMLKGTQMAMGMGQSSPCLNSAD